MGNLYDFNPTENAVPYEKMPEIDRYMLYTINRLTERLREAYDTFEFHIIYHKLYNYCTVDLSAFYLDILKDRLYTSPPESKERRSAQTVMHHALDVIARLMAPILPFTAEEIWRFIPANNHAESIHLVGLPEVIKQWDDAILEQKWDRMRLIRGEVTKALEAARAKKEIGHPLDAQITISADDNLIQMLKSYKNELRSIFIVSDVVIGNNDNTDNNIFKSVDVAGLSIKVTSAPGEKCDRCWVSDTTVGQDSTHPTACKRCINALKQINK